MKVRKSICFGEEIFTAIEEYRKSKMPIPTFTAAVNELCKKALVQMRND